MDVSIAITDRNGNAIALRFTNRSGTLDEPVAVEVPDLYASQSPGTQIIPFSVVDLYADIADYERIEIRNLQIFPSTVTVQNLEMIPLSQYPDPANMSEIFDTPPQDL